MFRGKEVKERASRSTRHYSLVGFEQFLFLSPLKVLSFSLPFPPPFLLMPFPPSRRKSKYVFHVPLLYVRPVAFHPCPTNCCAHSHVMGLLVWWMGWSSRRNSTICWLCFPVVRMTDGRMYCGICTVFKVFCAIHIKTEAIFCYISSMSFSLRTQGKNVFANPRLSDSLVHEASLKISFFDFAYLLINFDSIPF